MKVWKSSCISQFSSGPWGWKMLSQHSLSNKIWKSEIWKYEICITYEEKSSLSGVQKFIKSLWRTQFTKWFNGNDLLIPAPSISYWLNRYAVLLSCKEMGHAGRWSPEEAALHSPHVSQSKPHCSGHISASAGTCPMAELWVHPLLSGGLGAGAQGPESRGGM